MDEIVFIIFGVLSVMLVGGVIVNFVGQEGQRQATVDLKESLTTLQAFCDNICQQPEDTLKKTEITLTKDAILHEANDRICINDNCARCRCPVNIENVNLTDAPFRSRPYTCFFYRTQDAVNISCAG